MTSLQGSLQLHMIYPRECSEDVDPPFIAQTFSRLLTTLKRTFAFDVALRVSETADFYEVSGRIASGSQLPLVQVLYIPPDSGWNPDTDKSTLERTLYEMWPNQVYFELTEKIPSSSTVPPLRESLKINLVTRKTSRQRVKANLNKISAGVLALADCYSLSCELILQTREEEGLSLKLVKGVQAGIPVVEAVLDVDQACQIPASFDKDLYDALVDILPHPLYHVHITRK